MDKYEKIKSVLHRVNNERKKGETTKVQRRRNRDILIM